MRRGRSKPSERGRAENARGDLEVEIAKRLNSCPWSLHCGTAIFPRDNTDLEQLLHLSYLEEVSVENDDVWDDDSQLMLMYDGEDESPIVCHGPRS